MTERPNNQLWWQQGIVYQIYPRSFLDTDGDGVGNLAGVTARLDYLHKTLGITALWLSPFYPSPMADFGYDVSDYVDVNPLFGTLADFDELVREAHDRDLKIIVDWVPNHSSDQHPWFLESRSSRTNPKRDWYIWRDPGPDGSMPNNWLANFGGHAWEWDATTKQYYLHSFLPEQPDLNWRNPDLRRAMHDVLRFWLDRGVDGFRIDVAHLILKDPMLRDNPLRPPLEPALGELTREYDTQIHVNDKGHPDVHQAFREIRALLDSYSDHHPRFAVGEIYESDWEKWSSYYGQSLDELHMPYNFALLQIPWTATAVREVVEQVERSVPSGAWPNYVLGNHDKHRVTSRIGRDRAPAAMLLLLTLRGTPTIYYGDEIGMQDGEIPLDRIQDPFEKNVPGLGLGRDPARTPMQWDSSANAGFCPEGVDPWLPVAGDYQTVNVAVEMDDPHSMLTITRKIIELRQKSPALTAGTYQSVNVGPEDCLVYLREYDDQRYLIALNFSGESRTLELPWLGSGEMQFSTYLDRHGPIQLDRADLRGGEGWVIKL